MFLLSRHETGDSQGLEKHGVGLGSVDVGTQCCCSILLATEQVLLGELRKNTMTRGRCHSCAEL